MESSQSTTNKATTLPKPPSHRLLFDRRYGWVFDEWKHPSEEALADGRGMFCILPLAKALCKTASQSVNHTAKFATEVFEKPDCLAPQALQTGLNNQLNNFISSIQKPEFNCLHSKEILHGKLPLSIQNNNLKPETHRWLEVLISPKMHSMFFWVYVGI